MERSVWGAMKLCMEKGLQHELQRCLLRVPGLGKSGKAPTWGGATQEGASFFLWSSFCAESSWLCGAVDRLLAQRYRDVWLVLVDSRVRGNFLLSFRETAYPLGTSPFSKKSTFLEK